MGNPPGDRLGEADRLSKRLLGTPRDGQNGGPSASTGGWRWSTDGTSSADLLNLRLRLLQPVRHVHFAIHRCRGGEVLLGLLALAGASVELAEAEVAVGDERAHAELVGERQRLSVVPGCVFAASGRRDVSDEAEGVGLVSPSPQSAGECQRLASVAVGLVDPPRPKGDRARAQKDERRPVVPEATGASRAPATSGSALSARPARAWATPRAAATTEFTTTICHVRERSRYRSRARVARGRSPRRR